MREEWRGSALGRGHEAAGAKQKPGSKPPWRRVAKGARLVTTVNLLGQRRLFLGPLQKLARAEPLRRLGRTAIELAHHHVAIEMHADAQLDTPAHTRFQQWTAANDSSGLEAADQPATPLTQADFDEIRQRARKRTPASGA